MEDDSRVQDLKNHLYREHASERVVETVEDIVTGRVFYYWVFAGQSYRTQADDHHDEHIEVFQVYHPMGSSPDSA